VPAAVALAEVIAALPDGVPAPFLQEAVLRIGAEAAAGSPRPVLYVDLDSAMVDLDSGVARLPAKARADYRGRYDEAPGLFSLMDPVPGAVEAFTRLAEVYDAYLLASAPWGGPTAWQHRVEWVQLHFGAEEAGNAAYRRLVLASPANLDRGAVLVSGADPEGADRFAGERIRFGDAPTEDWDAVLALLLAPERLRVRPTGAVGRSRDRVAGRPSLTAWVLEVLRARGGSASVVQVAHDVWAAHEEELRRSGDLFYTWQHDLRRVAAILRDEGRLAHSADGVWRLAR
jgi:5'-nucleotidase